MRFASVSAQGVPPSPTHNDPSDAVLKQVVSSLSLYALNLIFSETALPLSFSALNIYLHPLHNVLFQLLSTYNAEINVSLSFNSCRASEV